MNIRPLDDRVLIKVVEIEDMANGGIILPNVATVREKKEKSNRDEIVVVGPCKRADNSNGKGEKGKEQSERDGCGWLRQKSRRRHLHVPRS